MVFRIPRVKQTPRAGQESLMQTPTPIKTARLTLIPATVALARAETLDRPTFPALLGASVPDAWPPEMLDDALAFFLQQIEAAPEQAHWITWYGLLDGEGGGPPTLVASLGFFGPPQGGGVELGYSVLPDFQQQGYGVEAVGALTDWALAQPGVERITANVAAGNVASVRLLRRLDFAERGASDEPGHVRFEKVRGR